MAMSKDKKVLADQMLPAIQFTVTSPGITISSERLSNPRFVPFDVPGKCRNCKSSELELDHVVTKEGVTIYSNRFKTPKFVGFDDVYDFPDHCFFRLKCRGQNYNIPHSGNGVVTDQPLTLNAKGGIKRQLPIDDFLQPKKVKEEEVTDDSDIQVLSSDEAKENKEPEDTTGGEEDKDVAEGEQAAKEILTV